MKYALLLAIASGMTFASASARAEDPPVSASAAVSQESLARSYGLSDVDYRYCGFAQNYCVDETGSPLPFEPSPALHNGDPLRVTVFAKGCPGAGGPNPATCTFQIEASSLSLSKTAPVALPANALAPGVTREAIVTLDIPSVSSSSSPLGVRLRVYNGAKVDAAQVAVDSQLSFAVGTSGYYFEPTILFPTVFNGGRSVVGSPLQTGREEVVGVEKSNLGAIENVAVGVNVYPFGYPGSCVGSGWAINILGVCTSKARVGALLQPVTVQVGVAVGNNAFHNYYAGLGYSIIRGVALTGGMGFVQGQFLGPSLFEGEVVPIPTSGGIPGIQTKYMIQPYFGVSITPAIISSILSAIESIKSLAPAPQSQD